MIVIQRNRILLDDLDEDYIPEFVQKNTIWQPLMTFGYEEMYTALHTVEYNGKTVLAVPRNMPPAFLEPCVTDSTVVVDGKSYVPYKTCKFAKIGEARTDLQLELFDFLHGRGSFHEIANKPRRAVFVETGEGKTFTTLHTLSDMGIVAAICCPDKRAIKVWLEEAAKFTDLTEDEIAVVEGVAGIKRLLKKPREGVKLLLISTPTIGSVIDNDQEQLIVDLFTTYGIGVKVIDEMHLQIRAIFFLEMILNTFKTIYMTATDSRRIPGEDRLLTNMTPTDDCVYRQTRTKKFEYVKVKFYSNPVDEAHRKHIHKQKGFDSQAWTKYIFNEEWPYRDFMLNEVIGRTMDYALKVVDAPEIEEKPKSRIAILSKSKESNLIIYDWLKATYPDRSIGLYNSDIEDIHERQLQLQSDIIVSTDRSFAGILNVERLEVLICLTPMSAEANLLQIVGRLRKDPNKRRVFIQLCDHSFRKAISTFYRENTVMGTVSISEKTVVINDPMNEIEEG